MHGPHSQFMHLVKEVWNTFVAGRPIVRFANKLKVPEKKLQAWNKEVFEQIGQRVKNVEDKV